MIWRRLLTAALLAPLGIPPSQARVPSPRRRAGAQQRSSSIQLRRRLHVNTLITEPGTAEVEWNHSFSGEGAYSMPTTLKFTPEGRHLYWGRTEFSASLDLLTSFTQNGSRITQFGDRVTVGANFVLFDGDNLDLAIVPQSSFLARDDKGVRLGATAIARYDVGRNSAGLRITWAGATAPSPTNPAATLDIDAGFGRRLRSAGILRRLTLHGNAVCEKSASVPRQISLFEGVEYEFSEKVALDVSAQHFNVIGGPPDNQLVFGLTMNLGRVRSWFRLAGRPRRQGRSS